MLDYEILNKDSEEEVEISADDITEGAEPAEEDGLDDGIGLDEVPDGLDEEEEDDDLGFGKEEM